MGKRRKTHNCGKEKAHQGMDDPGGVKVVGMYQRTVLNSSFVHIFR